MKHTLMLALAGGAAVIGLICVAGTAFAIGGCVDSPENPTWILAGIGGLAAGVPWLRSAVKRHRNRGNHGGQKE